MVNARSVTVLMIVLGFWACGTVAASSWEARAREICEPMGVPLQIVQAIIEVESDGRPYALNVRIGEVLQAYDPTSHEVAKLVLESLLMFTRHIDVGLMQINVAVWADELSVSPLSLLEPETNLWAGCTILARQLEGSGPLWQRLGRYHSNTPWRNEQYALKVLRAALKPQTRANGGKD